MVSFVIIFEVVAYSVVKKWDIIAVSKRHKTQQSRCRVAHGGEGEVIE